MMNLASGASAEDDDEEAARTEAGINTMQDTFAALEDIEQIGDAVDEVAMFARAEKDV